MKKRVKKNGDIYYETKCKAHIENKDLAFFHEILCKECEKLTWKPMYCPRCNKRGKYFQRKGEGNLIGLYCSECKCLIKKKTYSFERERWERQSEESRFS